MLQSLLHYLQFIVKTYLALSQTFVSNLICHISQILNCNLFFKEQSQKYDQEYKQQQCELAIFPRLHVRKLTTSLSAFRCSYIEALWARAYIFLNFNFFKNIVIFVVNPEHFFMSRTSSYRNMILETLTGSFRSIKDK